MVNHNKIRIGFILVLICLLFLPNAINLSFSQNKDKLQKDKSKIEKDIEYTNKLLKETKKNKQISLSQLMILNNKISMREELIDALSEDITGLDNKILSTSSIIQNLEQQLQGLKNEYAQMIYYAYKNRSSYNILLFLFSAKDFNQAYKRLKYMQQYSQYRKEQAEMIIKTEMKLSEKVSELKEKKNSKETVLKDKETEKEELSKEKQEKNLAIKKLKAKEKELVKTLKEKEKAAKKLQQAIEMIISEEIRKSTATKKVKKVTTKEDKKVVSIYELTPEEQIISNDFQNNKGSLPWPSEKGVVVSSFGSHPHPVLP
ncbi:MAG: hypothetical protein PHD97_12255, partial [Bacteroidales bacterium]|nr:hypothetical protein [Bacteroidales bacterium]